MYLSSRLFLSFAAWAAFKGETVMPMLERDYFKEMKIDKYAAAFAKKSNKKISFEISDLDKKKKEKDGNEKK